jgi:DNA/RNA-binding domain of Phe-tRNA-synthetase-like protein
MRELDVGRLTLRITTGVVAGYPDYRAGVVVAENLVNGPPDERSEAPLVEAQRRWQSLARPADHPHIAAWRAAFSRFGAKPSRYPSSAEALMHRAIRGQELPRINRLVDLYNAVSVTHAIPVGGEDLDAIAGPVTLAHAAGTEPFDPRDDSGGDAEHPRPGEVVWADALGVTCRRWNWRQGRRTQLTPDTAAAYFLFDALGPCDDAQLAAAMDHLCQLITEACPRADLASGVLGAGAGVE